MPNYRLFQIRDLRLNNNSEDVWTFNVVYPSPENPKVMMHKSFGINIKGHGLFIWDTGKCKYVKYDTFDKPFNCPLALTRVRTYIRDYLTELLFGGV